MEYERENKQTTANKCSPPPLPQCVNSTFFAPTRSFFTVFCHDFQQPARIPSCKQYQVQEMTRTQFSTKGKTSKRRQINVQTPPPPSLSPDTDFHEHARTLHWKQDQEKTRTQFPIEGKTSKRRQTDVYPPSPHQPTLIFKNTHARCTANRITFKAGPRDNVPTGYRTATVNMNPVVNFGRTLSGNQGRM